MAQITIDIPTAALPHLAEVKAQLEVEAGGPLTNEQALYRIVRQEILGRLGRVRHESAVATAVQQMATIEADYPE